MTVCRPAKNNFFRKKLPAEPKSPSPSKCLIWALDWFNISSEVLPFDNTLQPVAISHDWRRFFVRCL